MGRDKGVVVQATTPATGVLKQDNGEPNLQYQQPLAENMGIRDTSKVDYVQAVSEAGAKIAISVILTGSEQEPGTIAEVNDDKRTGILLDSRKQQLRFEQAYLDQLKLGVGSACAFSRVDVSGRDQAVALIAFDDPKARR